MMTSIETVTIEGIEATQATQFYRSERYLDAATSEPDNSVPLVAGKPLVLRLYPDIEKPPACKESCTVDGELWFRSAAVSEWQQSARFPSIVLGRRSTEIDRGDANQTLNFRIQERFAKEIMHVRTRVWTESSRSTRCYSDWYERTFNFVDTRPLRLRLYGVHYRGNGLDLAAPTAAQALHTLNYLRKTYPVSRIEVASYEVIDFSGDLTDRTGPNYGRGWGELLLLLSRLRAASVSFDPHFALLPDGVPNNGCGGFGSSMGVGASYVGNGSAMAQEVAHIYCRRHAPGESAPAVDPNFPSYGRYASGSIGEYGFDAVTGQVFSPASCHDFMSYCGNYWVSPYTYRGLLNVFSSSSVISATEQAPHSPNDNGHEYLHLGFSVRDDRGIELEHGLTLPDSPIKSSGGPTRHRIEVRDEQDQLLSSRTICSRDGHQQSDAEDDEERHYLESIPICADARRLAVVCFPRRDVVTFEIPNDDLKISFVEPAPGKSGDLWEGIVELNWELVCGHPDRLVFFLRYSCDGGASWRPVNIGFEWKRCSVDLERLPGGDDCRFQIIASTILQTATAQTESFRVCSKPRRASLAPLVQHAASVELVGTAHSPKGFAADGDLIWTSSLQGQLATGSYVTVHDLLPGDHEIALTAPDGLGGKTREMAFIHMPSSEIADRRAKDLG